MENKNTELHKLELVISHMLRGGIIVSGAMLFVGWIWLWINQGDLLQNFTEYKPQPLLAVMQSALQTHNYATLLSIAGLALLVCLPIIRVLLTVFLFIKQKDMLLAMIALAVFVILIFSFMLGIEL